MITGCTIAARTALPQKPHAGYISHEIAKNKAEHEYELYKAKRNNADNKAVEQLEQAINRRPRKTTASGK